MPSLSPNVQTSTTPTSPRIYGQRPALSKRHSTQSSTMLSRQGDTSPGSIPDHSQAQVKHAVRSARHAKIVLPRNLSSGRNLAKLARQAQQQQQQQQLHEDTRRHGRQKSHDHKADTAIRLPGSLDDSRPPAIRRNLTSHQLPRANSNVKLKKNLSHGHLSRLQSNKALSVLSSTHHRAPPSPGLKGKSKRPKSIDLEQELDLHEQEVAILQKQQDVKQGRRKIGFAVGSIDDGSDDEEVPDMEGSGLQEDEWTEESTSASPYSTRQNTASNSRRASVVAYERTIDRANVPPDPGPIVRISSASSHTRPMMSSASYTHQSGGAISLAFTSQMPATTSDDIPTDSSEDTVADPDGDAEEAAKEEREDEEGETDEDAGERIATSAEAKSKPTSITNTQSQDSHNETANASLSSNEYHRQPVETKSPQKSPLHVGKEMANPAARRILSSQQLPAPAMISNVNTLDDGHHSYGSNATSRRSSHVEGSVEGEDELVSRFVGSTSHPGLGSGIHTTVSTPRQGGSTTPLEEHMRRSRGQAFPHGPISPGSTVSGGSGAATPAFGRSRIELKMLGEKALADREAIAERAPMYPHHVYDRRNETLKSTGNANNFGDGRTEFGPGMTVPLGPEIFQGRFKAVNTELKVVLRFRDPIVESIERLRQIKGSMLNHRSSTLPRSSSTAAAAAALKSSKSAVSLPVRQPSKLSTSTTPPSQAFTDSSTTTMTAAEDHVTKSSASALNGTKNEGRATEVRRMPRRGVSFAGAIIAPESLGGKQDGGNEDESTPDAIARRLWDGIF